MPRSKHLREAGIAKRTIKIYEREVSLFLSFLHVAKIPLPSNFRALDNEVSEFINLMYQEGESISRAGWLLSGLKRLYPRCRRELCISQQWYTNWTREHVPTRATPRTWEMVQAFIGLCLRQKWPHLGLIFLLGFVFFLRIGEVIGLALTDIECDLTTSTVLIRLVNTKTSRQHQQFVAHTDSNFALLTHYFLRSVDPSIPLWPCSLSYFRICFRAVTSFFDLDELNLVPYSLRRGGASYFYGAQKALDFVMIQGRWKDQRTARLYLDDARASLISMQLSPTSKALISSFRVSFLRFCTSLRK